MPDRDGQFVPEPWGEDARLVEQLGERGAAEFRALLDGFPEAVGLLWAIRDSDQRIVDFAFGYGNPSMLRSFRLPPAMARRYTLLEALPRMRGSSAFDAYARVCDSGQPLVQEVSYDTPFGDGYMLGTFIQRVAKLGEGLFVFLDEVTDERRMEQELESYARVAAHDLRDPISSIAMHVALLERHSSEPPSDEVLRLLRASAERAGKLIDAIFSYARSGELRIEPVSLGRLTAEVVDDLKPLLDEVGATIEVDELPEVSGDPRQLRRVLQNLLSNALRFRGEEPPRVRVSAAHDSYEWVVTVSDNGIGVEPEQVGRIFGMFARGGPVDDGTGIGLAVCRRVVEAHGGHIWVDPAENGGSAFRFTLPHRRARGTASRMVDAPEAGNNRVMDVSILIVDDHAGFRKQARRLLEDDGYRVVGEAEDSKSALNVVGELEPDLVLVDIYLPDENGFELTSHLLSADQPPEVILISSHEGSEFDRCVPESGARGFVSKSELSREAIEAVLR